MQLPKTYKGLLKLLIAIAESGHPNHNLKSFTDEDYMNFGGLIAGIQNDLGEMRNTLEKLKLQYNGSNS